MSMDHPDYYSTSNVYVSPNATYGLQEALGTGSSDATLPGPFGGYTTIFNYLNHATSEQSSTSIIFFDAACPQNDCVTACTGANFASSFQLNGNGLQILHNCNLLPIVAIGETQGNQSNDDLTAIETVFTLDINVTSTAIQYINTLLGKSLMSRS